MKFGFLKKKNDERPARIAALARQPIFDRNREVVGYELLYRNGGAANAAVFEDGNLATAKLLVNSYLEFGIEKITWNKPAYVNLTRDYLVGDIALPIKSSNLVLEILEDVADDEDCVAGVEALFNQGYVMALDDVTRLEGRQGLIPFVRIVKVDLPAMDREELRRLVQQLRPFQLKLLAEKVESAEDFELCRELGFHYFQGYFFARPTIVQGKQLPPNQVVLLEMLASLQSSDCSMDEIENIVSRDVGVSYKLLKIINSSYYNLGYRVDSIQHALVVLGLNAIKKWIMIMSLAMVEDKPDELISLSLIRARMCEALAAGFGCRDDAAFTIGLFSLLDVLMDQPLEELLASLPLSQDLSDALLERRGPLGKVLKTVEAYERANWDSIDDALHDGDTLPEAYLEAIGWACDVNEQLRKPL